MHAILLQLRGPRAVSLPLDTTTRAPIIGISNSVHMAILTIDPVDLIPSTVALSSGIDNSNEPAKSNGAQ